MLCSMLASSLWAGTSIEMAGTISEERTPLYCAARTSLRCRRVSSAADPYRTR